MFNIPVGCPWDIDMKLSITERIKMNILYLSSYVNCKSHKFRIMNFFLFLSIERKKNAAAQSRKEQRSGIREIQTIDMVVTILWNTDVPCGAYSYDTEHIFLYQILGVIYTNSTPSYHLTHNHYLISLQ